MRVRIPPPLPPPLPLPLFPSLRPPFLVLITTLARFITTCLPSLINFPCEHTFIVRKLFFVHWQAALAIKLHLYYLLNKCISKALECVRDIEAIVNVIIVEI